MLTRRTIVEQAAPKRLQKLNRLPTCSDLQNLFDESSKFRCESLLLPWQCGLPPQIFGMTLVFPADPYTGLPRWVYYSGLAAEPKVEWVYETPDVALIHNMLLCAFADEVLAPEAHSSYAYSKPVQAATEPPSRPVWIKPDDAPSENIPILRGTVQKLQMDVLLQSLVSSSFTGKIQAKFHALEGTIFFDEGSPVHCQLGREEGSEAMIELLTWKVGDFEVFEEEALGKRTIKKRMQALLMESATLMDYRHFLAANKIDTDTIMALVPMSHEQFVERTRDAVPVDEALQRALANCFDGRTTIKEATSALTLSSARWTPLIYNMVKCGLIRKVTGASAETVDEGDHVLVDRMVVQEIRRSLSNSTTGLYSAAAFMYLLDCEFTRHSMHRRPFSLALIQVKKEHGPKADIAAVTEIIKHLADVLRASDLLCHFDRGYGVILPETDKEKAEEMVLNIVNFLSAASEKNRALASIWMKIGSASVPGDADALSTLISVALHKDNSSILRL